MKEPSKTIRTHINLDLVKLDDARSYNEIILFDCEYTCWPNSLISNWADLTQLPEVVQIGIILFQKNEYKILEAFSRYVKPNINPILSDYCKDLLKIGQNEIDRADSLPHVVDEILSLLKINSPLRSVMTCSWGYEDRIYLAEDSSRNGCQDPFSPLPHLDLMRIASQLMREKGTDGVEREEIRQKIGFKSHTRNHDALDDTFDLLEIFQALVKSHG